MKTDFKKLLLFVLLTIIYLPIKAQSINDLPQFHLLKNDGSFITQANLKKNEKVIVIYFGTDCSHCKLYTKELLKHMDVLAKTQILMITWSDLKSIQDFYSQYGLANYPNFLVTSEGYTYNLYRFFHVKTTPYTAVYDKRYHLIKIFDKSPVIDSLLAAVKKE